MNKKETFEIKLPLFEGPFDLLLFFIERDELDIYDIPIAGITSDFLSYLNQLEDLNVEVASEFILVASTLMRIKAKMLLPRTVIDEEGNEIDPREELVRHLLEYKKYKSVVSTLAEMELERSKKETRGNLKQEVKFLSEHVNVESELQDVDLYKLMKVFQKVLKRHEMDQQKPTHTVVQYPYTIDGQKKSILKRLITEDRLSFEALLSEKPEKIYVIFNFLSILELLQLKQISISLGEGFNNFWISKKDESEETTVETQETS